MWAFLKLGSTGDLSWSGGIPSQNFSFCKPSLFTPHHITASHHCPLIQHPTKITPLLIHHQPLTRQDGIQRGYVPVYFFCWLETGHVTGNIVPLNSNMAHLDNESQRGEINGLLEHTARTWNCLRDSFPLDSKGALFLAPPRSSINHVTTASTLIRPSRWLAQ